ncbi:MAG: hypothetical protein Q9173_007364 [Seirophora scorigena]
MPGICYNVQLTNVGLKGKWTLSTDGTAICLSGLQRGAKTAGVHHLTDLVAAFLAHQKERDIAKLKWPLISDIIEKGTIYVVVGITEGKCMEVTGTDKTDVEKTILGKLAVHFAADFGFQIGKVFAFVPQVGVPYLLYALSR